MATGKANIAEKNNKISELQEELKKQEQINACIMRKNHDVEETNCEYSHEIVKLREKLTTTEKEHEKQIEELQTAFKIDGEMAEEYQVMKKQISVLENQWKLLEQSIKDEIDFLEKDNPNEYYEGKIKTLKQVLKEMIRLNSSKEVNSVETDPTNPTGQRQDRDDLATNHHPTHKSLEELEWKTRRMVRRLNSEGYTTDEFVEVVELSEVEENISLIRKCYSDIAMGSIDMFKDALAMAEDAAAKGDTARRNAQGMEEHIAELEAKLAAAETELMIIHKCNDELREKNERIASLEAIIEAAKEAVKNGWNPVWELETKPSGDGKGRAGNTGQDGPSIMSPGTPPAPTPPRPPEGINQM